MLPLVQRWLETGEPSYRDRAMAVARSWVLHDPPSAPASDFSWDEHATALRAVVLTCLAQLG